MVSFPSESRINPGYLSNSVIKGLYESAAASPSFYVAENQTTGITQYPNFYPDDLGDLHIYNSAYSANNIAKLFPIKPFDFQGATTTADNMVASSERKFTNEYSDSWLKFKYNNYLELEGEYGAITRLVINNEKMLAFQPRGIAVLSILDREVVQTNNTAELAVGTGGVLSRYDYISKNTGSSIYEAIIPTEKGLYFYDDKNHAIYRITDTLESISDTKGMKAYFESTPHTSLLGAYDRDNREVLFTPSGYDTLVFSGLGDVFESFFTLGAVTNYITFDRYLLSSLEGNIFYLHNHPTLSKPNVFYGTYKTSTLSPIVNPQKTNVCTFNVIEWLTDLRSSADVDVLANTFDSVTITDTHQNTGLISLDPATNTDLKRRFRKWRLNIFRDQTLEGGVACNKRIRDSWMKPVFSWVQTASLRKLVVYPINFYYSYTKLK
jgi:hypothetical protein